MDSPPPGDAARRVALVTGATGGIGEATCRALAARGATVLAAARNRVRAEALCAQLRAAGGRAHALCLDVAEAAELSERIGAAVAELGPVTWLVNNAGIAESCKLDAPDAPERLARMLDVNLHGALRCFAACLTGMRAAGGGHVVQVASSAALRGYPYVSGYAATKHALLGWTRSAALELVRERIGVSAVCPHYVDSPMTAATVDNIVHRTGRTREDAYASIAQMNPGGRLVATDDVARAVCELLEGRRGGVVVELDGAASRVVEEGLPFPPG